MASSVFTRKTAPPQPGGHVFRQIYITKMRPPPGSHETNVLTTFHVNWVKNVTSTKSALLTGGHVFSPIWTIFKLFHDDWAKTVSSRVFTRKTAPPTGGHFHEDRTRNVASRVFKRKTAPPTGSNVFQRTGSTFELN
ncbi:hypothetical protein DPMN_120332 [Dreissena polymorpha]|uniref:Uncharacterized protein n=1 Tax=Dreissena polymorpha TaxID=45954 RepID=A0A9D4GNS2_DREPO|nr:hypothetical protein DPMN_120332 [Dreissena polymorpha]